MKELRNSFDHQASFSDLQEAKNYYLLDENLLSKEDYIGDDFDDYVLKAKEYNEEIISVSSLEDLAVVLNRYTDLFEDGREHTVVEF